MKGLKALFALQLLMLGACASQTPSTPPAHLQLTHQLLKEAAPEHVSYQHSPTVVVLEEDDRDPARVHADCSGLVNAVLKRAYSVNDEQFAEILGARRPIVRNYAAAIEHEHGFTRIRSISEVKAGDILASPYKTSGGDSGHVMIVDETPREEAADFTPADLTRYVVRIVDSTSSRHGAPDSRVAEGKIVHTGLGTGMITLWCAGQEIAGYSWGTSRTSKIWRMDERPLYVGRFEPPQKKTP